MTNIIVRPARLDDQDEIIHFLSRLGVYQPGNEAQLRRNVSDLISRKGYHLLVAEVEGLVVGYVVFVVLPSVASVRDRLEITELVVYTHQRFKGVAERLVEEVVRRAQSQGFAEVVVATSQGEGFYLTQGFQPAQKQFVRRTASRLEPATFLTSPQDVEKEQDEHGNKQG